MRRYLLYLIILLVLAGCSAGRGCRPDVEPPPTVTPTIPAPPTIAATVTPTAIAAPVTRTPVAPSVTPESATATATATIAPTVAPTATPATPQATEPVKGVHTVRRGDTLWGIACQWYADMPLLPDANPLTPCTCWPGIYWRNGALHTPQLIYPGEQYLVPLECKP